MGSFLCQIANSQECLRLWAYKLHCDENDAAFGGAKICGNLRLKSTVIGDAFLYYCL